MMGTEIMMSHRALERAPLDRRVRAGPAKARVFCYLLRSQDKSGTGLFVTQSEWGQANDFVEAAIYDVTMAVIGAHQACACEALEARVVPGRDIDRVLPARRAPLS